MGDASSKAPYVRVHVLPYRGKRGTHTHAVHTLCGVRIFSMPAAPVLSEHCRIRYGWTSPVIKNVL